jgi:2-polyprenyl-6-hydroxyphenyl methylase/3-demethylubiquinone-9 3-methyltransferase
MQSELTRELDFHADDVAHGERFEFGRNWARFLSSLNDERIVRAEQSLKKMLEIESLERQRFLDIGSGSGLFSLAARKLGARVHSFDFDPQSVACTLELRRRYFPGDDCWSIDEASVLNLEYLKSLGKFDVVYSWGVLHHTGRMWEALENVHVPLAPNGKLYIAIYNDMGSQSRRWRLIKHAYNKLPKLLRAPFASLVAMPEEGKAILRSLITMRPQVYLRSWTDDNRIRGMSHWHDIIDWVGGYPYEVARPEEIFDFCRERGLSLKKMKCGGVGLGCNEFVFIKGDEH